MNLDDLRIDPNNPFPFEGSEAEWENFVASVKRDTEFLEGDKIHYDSENNNLIIVGNKRVAALRELGYTEIDDKYVLDVSRWSQEKRRRKKWLSNIHFGTYTHEIPEDIVEMYNIDELPEAEDVDMSSFWEESSHQENARNRIVLEYTAEEFEIVNAELNKRKGSKEEIIYKLLVE